MLNKLLLILSAVALAGGTFLGFKNRQAFIETRTAKIELNSKGTKPLLAKIEEEVGNVDKEIALWKDASASKKEKEVALANNEANFKAKTDDLAKLTKDIDERTAEVAKMEAELAEQLGGESIDTITSKLEKLNQEIAALKADAENATKELEVAQKKVADTQATVASLEKSASMRNKGISLNSIEGTVIATNQDYGFAVVNIGQNRGVTGGSKFIVKRGDQRIGLLNISSVSADKTIADIELDSLTSGYSVSPGDKVIFEKVQR